MDFWKKTNILFLNINLHMGKLQSNKINSMFVKWSEKSEWTIQGKKYIYYVRKKTSQMKLIK